MLRPLLCLLLGWLLVSSHAQAAKVQLGNELLAAGGFKELQGKRIALLTNPSGVNQNLESTIQVLQRAPGVKLVALFAPEHGIYGNIGAGIEFRDSKDPRTSLPVFSLYGPGPTRKPTLAMLKGIDAVVYDMQDTGCRSYTFITTMGMTMDMCGQTNVEFIVLDRPNPLGGERIEGPMLDPKLRSHVGHWNVPYVYGMTSGELARMIHGERWVPKPGKLTIVPMRGWTRDMSWADTGLPWVPTSPHVPQGDSPMYQVATGMLGEIGGVSIGIGYTLPFQCIAAPWLDGGKLADYMNGRGLAGVRFVPITYQPFYGAYRDQLISGVQMHMTDPARAPLTAINFHALEACKKLGGRDLFAEAAKGGKNFGMFDKVNGTDVTRRALQAGVSAATIVASWRTNETAFRLKRQKYLLY